ALDDIQVLPSPASDDDERNRMSWRKQIECIQNRRVVLAWLYRPDCEDYETRQLAYGLAHWRRIDCAAVCLIQFCTQRKAPRLQGFRAQLRMFTKIGFESGSRWFGIGAEEIRLGSDDL